ncbi:hypothetical protein DL95DRAFT_307602, partial [Leptodontidium sp. 2 PMI_412]
MEFSTFINSTAVMTTDICANDGNATTVAQCAYRRGSLFNTHAVTGNITDVPLRDLPPDLEWPKLNPSFPKAVKMPMQLAPDTSLSNFTFALVSDARNSSIHQIGIGSNSTFLHHLVDNHLAPGNSFSYMAGSQSPTNPRDGHLIVGGYDKSSVAGTFSKDFPIYGPINQGERGCALHVTIDQLTLTLPGQSDIPMISGSLMGACIEPLDNVFRFPTDKLKQFKDLTSYDPNVVLPKDLLVIEEGLYYPQPFNGTLTFHIQGGPIVIIPSSELSWPVQALAPNGTKVTVPNTNVVNIFHKDAEENTPVLGKVFLSQLLLAVNY